MLQITAIRLQITAAFRLQITAVQKGYRLQITAVQKGYRLQITAVLKGYRLQITAALKGVSTTDCGCAERGNDYRLRLCTIDYT